MAVESFVVRRNPFSSDRISQYTELPNMGNRESTHNSTSTTSFFKGHRVVRETDAFGPVTLTVIGQRYEDLLSNYIIPDLQQLGCVDGNIFMLDGAPPHIPNPVKKLLKGILEMLELSVAISLQSGRPDDLILIPLTSGCRAI
ncbi:UNVERIFIED_CONTAM: hypothetical protein NCL1_27711 [Trichonephila clavipes]